MQNGTFFTVLDDIKSMSRDKIQESGTNPNDLVERIRVDPKSTDPERILMIRKPAPWGPWRRSLILYLLLFSYRQTLI